MHGMTSDHPHPRAAAVAAHDHDSVGAPAAVAGDRRGLRLGIALALTLLMLAVEAAGGLFSGSLALLADAGHMLIDSLALGLAWASAGMALRQADPRRSFGYARFEVLAGFVNALTQFLLVGWIAWEAVQRLLTPHAILSGVMLAVAVVGLVVNALVLRLLHRHDHDDVNMAAANLHVLGDLLGSVATVVAALLVRWERWLWADPALSLLVCALLLRSAFVLLRRSTHILLEGTPEGLDPGTMALALRAADAAIRDVHHLHLWQIASGQRMATLHVRVEVAADAERALRAVKTMLHDRYAIGHATVEIERDVCSDPSGHGCASG
jgi:cobalt-zinc-cadmium efflux system protein